jgi:hypothetical protein
MRKLAIYPALIACTLIGCARKPTPADIEAASATPASVTAEKVGDGFAFPKDRGGQLLSTYLPPTTTGFHPEPPRTAVSIAPVAPIVHEPKALAFPPSTAEVPRLTVAETRRPLRPVPLTDEPPLSANLTTVVLPGRERLPVMAGIHLPSPSGEEPAPLPILARAKEDRASLADPTAEASRAAALTATPQRTEPAPFQKVDMGRGQSASARLKGATEELVHTGTPQPPKP